MPKNSVNPVNTNKVQNVVNLFTAKLKNTDEINKKALSGILRETNADPLTGKVNPHAAWNIKMGEDPYWDTASREYLKYTYKLSDSQVVDVLFGAKRWTKDQHPMSPQDIRKKFADFEKHYLGSVAVDTSRFTVPLAAGGVTAATDRLGLERPVLSRDFENKPMAGWEKAAALMGAAVSPASTIASMVLAPPEEETLFDRQIIGPDGKPTILPKTSETVVPRMKKQQRTAMKPNPVISVLQRHFAKGPTGDPANDIIHQKINDRNFLVHATRPSDAKRIKDIGGVMPSGENLPRQILKDPVVKKAIEDGKFRLEAHSISSDKPTHIVRDDGRRYRLVGDKELALGRPALTPSSAPGVSLSRQMTVPALNPEKSYRFLLDPAGQKTFSTAEPGFNKPYAYKWHTSGGDMHESEQRTFGVPYPVKVGTRATTPSTPKGPTEEMVPEEKTHYYRATMGNENIKKLQERLGVVGRSRRDELWDEYQKLDKLGSDLYDQLSGMKPTDPFYKTTLAAWTDAAKKAKEAGDAYYGVKSKSLMSEIPKSDFDAWEPKPVPISKPAPAPAPKVASTPKTSDFDAWDDFVESTFPGWKKLITEKKQLSKKYLAQMNDPSTSMSAHIKTAEELAQATDAVTEFMKKMGLK